MAAWATCRGPGALTIRPLLMRSFLWILIAGWLLPGGPAALVAQDTSTPAVDSIVTRSFSIRRGSAASISITNPELPVDQLDLAMANYGYRWLDLFERNPFTKELAIGIVDVHTHVCTRPGHYVEGQNTTTRGMWFVQLLDDLGKAMGLANGTKDMTPANFGKMILEGSDTSVAIFNPFGFREDYGGKDMIPIEEQAEVKRQWPDRTAMLGGGLTPNQGLTVTLERLQMFVEKYKIAGLKLYTFDSTSKRGWWFDDQKLAYPIWERCRKLGIKNIGCHKGIPFGQFMARYAHPEDLDAAADDFRDLNFIAYHSAWPYHVELAALKGFKPQRTNLYCEIGSTFAATVTARPLECAHVLGTLLRDLGADYVMWGTDSLLWGNPQWQIDAFRKFQIPDQLVEGHGYPKLTDEIKAKVFGLNAARAWNLKTATAALPVERPRVVAV